MKHLFYCLISTLVLTGTLAGADWQIQPDGRTRFGEYEFFVAHWSKGWAYREQSAKTVHFSSVKATSTPRGLCRTGTFQAAAGTFQFAEFRKDANGALTLGYELTSQTPVPTENLALMTRMNAGAMLKRPLTLNGKALAFPKITDRTKAFIEHKISTKDLLILPTTAGNLEIRFNGRVTLEDDRRSGKNFISIRFQFYPPRSMALTRSGITITMRLRKDSPAPRQNRTSVWQVKPDGRTKVGEYEFGIGHWSKGWAYREQSGQTVTFPGEGAAPTARGMRRTGTFQVAAGAFKLTEYRKEEPGNKLTLAYELESENPVPTENLAFQTLMNAGAMLKRPLTLNGKALVFPKITDRSRAFIEQKVSTKDRLLLPTSAGNLEIRFNGRIVLEDNRRFGKNTISIRFLFYPARSMALTRSSMTVLMTLQEVRQCEIDLKKGMNMGFVDDTEGDGRGGWTDQGPENDMRMLKPGRLSKKGLSFQIVDPEKNQGKACIVLKGKARPAFPESVTVELADTPQGRMLYLLNCVAWPPPKGEVCGRIIVQYADGSRDEKALKRGLDTDANWYPSEIRNGNVFWSAMLKNVPIGLYASAIPVAGKPIRSLTFQSTGSVWCILGATLTESAVSLESEQRFAVNEGKEWGELPANGDVVPGSVLDFTSFIESPAGKYGFCRPVGDHLEFEKRPGVPVRLWGANVIFTVIFMENKEVDRMLDRFTANGMNFVRLCVDQDLYCGTFVKNMSLQERERRVDYFIAACIKRGIYLTIDLQGGRSVNAKMIGGPDRKMNLKEYRILSYFDPVIAADLAEHSRKLLTHVNSYTGRRLADEPGLAFLNLINESMLPDSAKETPFLRQRLEEIYAKKKGRKLSSLPESERNQEWHRFLREGYFEGRSRLMTQLKSWGVRCPVTDNNCLWFPRVSCYRKGLDLIANNTYWAHPVYLNTKETWVPPIAVSPASAIADQGGCFNPNSATRHLNAPFAITEWDFVNPNPYNVEGAFLMGGYAAMHNYAGLARFSYASWEPLWKNPRTQGYFDFHHDPLQTLSMRAGSCFFLRGDVTVAPRSIAYLFDETEIDGKNFRREFPEVMQRLALLTRTGLVFAPDEIPQDAIGCVAEKEELRPLPGTLPVVRDRAVRAALAALVQKKVLPQSCFDLRQGRYRSLTGELELNADKKSLRIVTPRSEGLIVDAGEKLNGKFLKVLRNDTFAAFLAASLDGKPLTESGRILLLHLTDAKGRDMVFRDRSMAVVEDFGKPGLLMKRGEADLALRLPKGAKIFTCDVNGKRISETKLMRANDGLLHLTARNFQNGKAVCVYEILRGSEAAQ